MDKPKTIYKYEGFNTNSLRNLKAQSLYFGSPMGFNDPYDCALSATIDDLSEEGIDTIRCLYSQEKDVAEKVKQEFLTLSNAEIQEKITKIALNEIASHKDEFLKSKGVACFSEVNDDLLMWSHYGGRYKGFCLEFSTKSELFGKLRKIEYQSKMPAIDLVKLLIDDNDEQILQIFLTKSESWSYEKEWRLIHNDAGTSYVYEPNALKAIYFGPDIAFEALEIVCLILHGQNPNVEFWRGTRSADEFKVNFEQFNYMSFLEATKRGLK